MPRWDWEILAASQNIPITQSHNTHPDMKVKPSTKSLALLAVLAVLGSANAATLYWGGGNSTIANDTTIPTLWSSLNGTWSSSISNFANSPTSPNTYQAWADGNTFSMTTGSYTANFTSEQTVVTVGSAVSLPTMNFALAVPSGSGNKRVTINASSAQTLTLSGLAPTIDVRATGSSLGVVDTAGVELGNTNLSLAGSSGFSKTGNYYLRILGSQNSLTGTVNVVHNANLNDGNAAGTLEIGTSSTAGTMTGITRFNISATNIGTAGAPAGGGSGFGNRSRLVVNNQSTSLNQLGDTAVINLGGIGVFDYQGRTGATETVGSLRLGSSGVLDLDSSASGTGALTFTNGIDRANNRAQLVVGLNTTSGLMTSTVNLGSSHGLGTNLLPWAADGTKGRFLSVDGSNNLITATPTDVTDLSTITSSTTNYRITGNSTAITNATFASGAQANTLGFYRSNNGGAVTVNVTDTLTIAGGGISVGNDNNSTQVTIQGGTSITTSGNVPLYISTGYSSATGTVRIDTPVTGAIDVVKTGASDFQFGGNSANTYNGTTYVNGGTLNLSKASGVTSMAGNGVVRSGGTLLLGQPNQIADTATVTVENGGYFSTGTNAETIANLAGGGMILSSGGTATTTITGSVSVGDGGIGTMINNRVGTGSIFRLNSGAAFNFELASNGGTSDQMAFFNYGSGEFVLNSNAINLSLVGAQAGGTYTVSLFKFYSDNGASLTNSGITSGLVIGTLGSGFDGTPTLSYNAGGNSIDLTYSVIPEPATWGLLAVGLTTIVIFRRRRRIG